MSGSAPMPSQPQSVSAPAVAMGNQSGNSENSDELSDTDNDDDLFKNTNHPPQLLMESSSSDESDNC